MMATALEDVERARHVAVDVRMRVRQRITNTRLRREGIRLKQREQETLAQNNRLKLEWARLVSPKRLEEIGREKYNLSRPRPEQVIVLSEP